MRFTDDAAARLAELVGGDPYLFQYVRQAARNAGDGGRVTDTDVEAADEATYAERALILRERGGWRVTHRLVRRLRETGDVV